MGKCFLYGNSSSSDTSYDVVCQTAEPTKKEGRIWIKSSVPITKLEIGLKWSSAAIGYVVIYGTAGGANPTSDNNIIHIINNKKIKGLINNEKITPYSCHQVQGSVGNWVNVDAYVCHSNTWVQFSWTKRYLIKNGVAQVPFTAKGTYLEVKWKDAYTATAPTIAGTSGNYYHIYIGGSSQQKSGIVATSSRIYYGGYTKVGITAKTNATSSDFAQYCGLWHKMPPNFGKEDRLAGVALPLSSAGETTQSFNCSGALANSIYIGFHNYCYNSQYDIYVKNLWLE